MRFPLFIELEGQRAVVIGGGTVGTRRAAALRDFGAAVTLISPTIQRPLAGIAHLPRPYRPGDLTGAWLAVAAADDRAVNHAVYEEATALGILVNVCDCPAECGFFFPAICEGGGLTAGVVGDGSDHRRTAAVAKRIRETLEVL